MHSVRRVLVSSVAAALVAGFVSPVVPADAVAPFPRSLFAASVKPKVAAVASSRSVNVGLRFSVPLAGRITGLRFYRGEQVRKAVSVTLWTSAGKSLGRVRFAASSRTGWRTGSLPKAVSVNAGASFVVSYLALGGHYPVTRKLFAKAYRYHGLKVAASGGRIGYGTSSKLPRTASTSNFFTDVVYTPKTVFYVDPQRQTAVLDAATNATERALLAKIADQPTSQWITGDTWDASTLTRVTADSIKKDRTPIAAFYNIPNRDCGGYAWGGAKDGPSYLAWVKQMTALTKGRYWIVLEPDALANADCTPGTLGWLHDAGVILRAAGNKVYLDIGNSRWLTPADAAAKIKTVGADAFDGVAVNVSNFETTADSRAYVKLVSAAYGSKLHFVVDTSRNGNGPDANHDWCNPPGRALGDRPGVLNASDGLDAELWVKPPGDSDGPCNGGPTSGGIWLAMALELARNAHW